MPYLQYPIEHHQWVVPSLHLFGQDPGQYGDYSVTDKPRPPKYKSVIRLNRRSACELVADIQLLWIPLRDTEDPKKLRTVREMVRLLEAVHYMPRPVLWHCSAGLNRSAYALCIYMVAYLGWAPERAIKHLRAVRSKDVLHNQLMVGRILAMRPGVASVRGFMSLLPDGSRA